MSAYAYFVQTCREEHKKKHPNEAVVFKDFTRKCADRWRTMNDKEKGRFHDMAKKDKTRYDNEMKSYVPPAGAGKGRGGGKKGKAAKDPNAPKRALSAFFWFCSDERPKVRAAHPSWSVGEVAKQLGAQWGNMTPAQKLPYEKKAEKDKARYEKENASYKKGGAGGGAKGKKAAAAPVEEEEEDDEEEDEDEDEEEEEDDE
jgi:uncharacterized short protein YbdD (DUF466 family)